MLDLREVSVSYDGTPAVREATLALPDGQVLAVLGPSGCGKSTLLRAVAGLEPLVAGTVAWDGADLARVPTHKRGFALMFQDGQLFAHLTVARNIGYALRLRRAGGIAARVAELLALVGLEGYDDRLPATLSGGERQRVALARCLAVRPRLLLLDEPLSALDTGLRQRLATDLRAILRHEGITALMVTHDHEEAFTVADRLAVMRAGRIVQQGAIAEVWRSPVDAPTALFLGYARVLEGPAAAVVRDSTAPSNRLRGAGTSRTTPPVRLAVRRSAFRVEGAGPLRGRVVEARVTPEQVRLVVDVEGIGEVDAVAPLDQHPAVGQAVRLGVDPTRTAAVGQNPVSRPAGPSLD
jgi:thiamine transport system ATP-binding protein